MTIDISSNPRQNRYQREYFEEQFTGVRGFAKKGLNRNINWFLVQLDYFEKRFHLNFAEAGSILEVGCAIGGIAHIFAKRKTAAYALDISSYAIERAKSLSPAVKFMVSDVQEAIPLEKKFDFIFAFEVLEHLDNPINGLKNIKVRLKTDGKLIATTPYPFKKYLDIKTHVNVLKPHSWIELMNEAGFKKIKFQAVTFLPYLYKINHKLGIIFPFNSNLPLINSTVFYVAQ